MTVIPNLWLAGKIRLVIMTTVVLVSFTASPALAQNTQGFTLSGVVTTVEDPTNYLGGSVSLGDPVSGVFYYDLDAVDIDSSPNVGYYKHNSSPYGISLRINSLTFRTDPANLDFFAVTVNNLSGRDYFVLGSNANIFPWSTPLSQSTMSEIAWELDDPSGTALSNTNLPTSFNLADWGQDFGLALSYVDWSSMPARRVVIRAVVQNVYPQAIGDSETSPGNDPNCQVCHGEVENNYDPLIAEESTSPQTSPLRNIVKFRNLYALQAMKVEKEHLGTTPTIDLGNASPLHPATGYFWTRVSSNAPYYETYSWTDFIGSGDAVSGSCIQCHVLDPIDYPGWNDFAGPSGTVTGSAAWMTVTVTDGPVSTLFSGHPANLGSIHPSSGTHIQTNPSSWEKVTLTITPPWNALPGIYQDTLDIVITQL